MQKILLKNKTHQLNLEKVKNNWWLELQELKTGKVQILESKSKLKIEAFVKGMSIDSLIYYFDKLKIEKVPMYKSQY
jgi:hypothetical protein